MLRSHIVSSICFMLDFFRIPLFLLLLFFIYFCHFFSILFCFVFLIASFDSRTLRRMHRIIFWCTCKVDAFLLLIFICISFMPLSIRLSNIVLLAGVVISMNVRLVGSFYPLYIYHFAFVIPFAVYSNLNIYYILIKNLPNNQFKTKRSNAHSPVQANNSARNLSNCPYNVYCVDIMWIKRCSHESCIYKYKANGMETMSCKFFSISFLLSFFVRFALAPFRIEHGTIGCVCLHSIKKIRFTLISRQATSLNRILGQRITIVNELKQMFSLRMDYKDLLCFHLIFTTARRLVFSMHQIVIKQ